MNTVIISKKLISESDLVVIARHEYEALLELQRIKEFTPTIAQKRSLVKAEENFKRGKTLSYNELADKLGFEN